LPARKWKETPEFSAPSETNGKRPGQAFMPNVNSPPPQVYAVGNFSKFVRSGYYRIDVSGAPTPRAQVLWSWRLEMLQTGQWPFVVVNAGAARNVSFFVAGTAWPASVTPYVATTSSKLQ
jgi:hypothetical protein